VKLGGAGTSLRNGPTRLTDAREWLSGASVKCRGVRVRLVGFPPSLRAAGLTFAGAPPSFIQAPMSLVDVALGSSMPDQDSPVRS
jgi:hypothetical protein